MQKGARHKRCVPYEMDPIETGTTKGRNRDRLSTRFPRPWEAEALRVSLDPGSDCWHCKEARSEASVEAEALNVDHMMVLKDIDVRQIRPTISQARTRRTT